MGFEHHLLADVGHAAVHHRHMCTHQLLAVIPEIRKRPLDKPPRGSAKGRPAEPPRSVAAALVYPREQSRVCAPGPEPERIAIHHAT